MPLVRTPAIGHEPRYPIGRRVILGRLASAGAALMLPRGARAAGDNKAVRTPGQTLGPFYPVDWLGDADNDLVLVTGEAAKAMGTIVHVSGRVLDLSGKAVAGAGVEIWQCDSNGVYRHPRDMDSRRPRDGGFQGHGRTVADASGGYAFRTIRPVAYPGRTPHIHFKIAPPKGRALVTQMYVLGEPLNEKDGILQSIRDPRQRESVIVRLDPAPGLEEGALRGVFDIVLVE